MRTLIVNADDFGRTPGINAGTLEAHRRGIVTSATVMVLEAAASEGVREALVAAPRLGLGLHVALTGGGPPACPAGSLPTLAPAGRLPRDADALPGRLPRDEVAREIEAQIARFEAIAGRLPTHLDSHHHSARHPDVEPAFAEAALRRGLPVRASDAGARQRLRAAGLRTPDHFLDAFYGEGSTLARLRALIEELPEGTSELMCHPGYPDEELLRESRYAKERKREVAALCDRGLPDLLRKLGVELAAFSGIPR